MIGKTLGNYKIIEEIGRGGMGVVYKAEHLHLRGNVAAIKVLPQSFASNPTLVERFHLEANSMYSLKHTNIVKVMDMGVQGEIYYFVMEYVEGESLRKLLDKEKTVLPLEALNIATQVCQALSYAHSEHVIHRDIKPGNILLDKSGKVKVSDFGLARIVGDFALSVGDLDTAISQDSVGDRPTTAGTRLTREGTSPGTIGYMSPEQRRADKETDQRTDIYSLGVVLYEMLTGDLPVGAFEYPSQVRDGVPGSVDETLRKALSANPERRYQSAGEMGESLSLDQSGFKVQKAAAAEPRKAITLKKKSRRRLAMVAVAVVIAAIAMSTAILRLKGPLPPPLEEQPGASAEKPVAPAAIAPLNKSPTVEITGGPEGEIGVNKATFTWRGTDEDGTVVEYLYSLDDSTPDKRSDGTSKTFTNLSAGEHIFYIKAKDNDGAYSKVASSRFRVRLKVKAAVNITTNPAGAQVYIGAELKGTTPIKELNLSPGSYPLVIEKEGYSPIIETLVVEEGKKVNISRNLSIITGTIEVTTRPAGVQVYLDGKARGVSPQTIPGVIVGSHEITLKHKDYYEKTIKVAVGEKKTSKIDETLKGLPGKILIISQPPGAEVYINGRDTGKKTTATLKGIKPGPVEITVKLKGYKAETDKEILNPNSSLTFNFTLEEQTAPQGLEAVGTATDPVSGLPLEVRSEKDGAEMVLIPAGEFLMGSNNGDSNEKPVHKVYVDAFYMDKYEVTVAQFRKFVEETGYRTDAEKVGWACAWTGNKVEKKEGASWRNPGFSQTDNHPVVDVSWNDAVAYAKWAGKRLPTEAEWEKAARGGLVGKKYPWGNEVPNGSQGNFADKNTEFGWSDKEANDRYRYTAPVGSYPPNGYGLYDMAGNVWEWVADWYDGGYYENSPYKNPKGPDSPYENFSGNYRVLRGGSWHDVAGSMRAALRVSSLPGYGLSYYGFRCARRAGGVSEPEIRTP